MLLGRVRCPGSCRLWTRASSQAAQAIRQEQPRERIAPERALSDAPSKPRKVIQRPRLVNSRTTGTQTSTDSEQRPQRNKQRKIKNSRSAGPQPHEKPSSGPADTQEEKESTVLELALRRMAAQRRVDPVEPSAVSTTEKSGPAGATSSHMLGLYRTSDFAPRRIGVSRADTESDFPYDLSLKFAQTRPGRYGLYVGDGAAKLPSPGLKPDYRPAIPPLGPPTARGREAKQRQQLAQADVQCTTAEGGSDITNALFIGHLTTIMVFPFDHSSYNDDGQSFMLDKSRLKVSTRSVVASLPGNVVIKSLILLDDFERLLCGKSSGETSVATDVEALAAKYLRSRFPVSGRELYVAHALPHLFDAMDLARLRIPRKNRPPLPVVDWPSKSDS
ncbi:hypothetical protein PYCC9005_004937 [Savitreella phatthalungensis]